MPTWLHVPRALTAYLLAIVAAFSLTLAVVQSWVSHAVFDEDRFASTAVDVAQRSDVQAELRRVLVNQIIEAQPDLVGVRPLLETVVEAVLDSGVARRVIADGARELHRILFRTDRVDLVLALPDVMTLIVASVRTYDPAIAERIPGGSNVGFVEVAQRNAATRIIEVDRQLESLRWVFIGLAVGALAAALVIAPSRAGVLALAGIGMVGGAIACWLAVGVIGDMIRSRISDNPVAADAGHAAWSMYAEGLIWWMWVQAIAGVVLATVASSARASVPARVRVEQFVRLVEAWWERRAARVGMAAALMVLGLLLLVSPLVTLRVLAQGAGLTLVYLGGVELVRSLGLARMRRREPGTEPRPQAARTERLLEAATATALLGGLAVVGAVFWFNRDSFRVAEAGVRPPIESCNGAASLCDRRLDEIAWAATHNSMAAAEEPGWFFSNHTRGVARQLQDGIRVLMIDVYYGYATNRGVRTDPTLGAIGNRFEGGLGPEAAQAAENLAQVIGPIPPGAQPSLYLCHGLCELGATPFETTLRELREFLESEPEQIVVLFLQDYVDPYDVEAAFTRAALTGYVYTLTEGEQLPTLREMIELDRRVLVLSENGGGRAAPPWYHDAFAVTQDTPFLFRAPGELSCAANRGDDDAPFFLVNHWLTTRFPAPADSQPLNDLDFLLDRVQRCEQERGRVANFIAVNFYEEGDLFEAVAALNDERAE